MSYRSVIFPFGSWRISNVNPYCFAKARIAGSVPGSSMLTATIFNPFAAYALCRASLLVFSTQPGTAGLAVHPLSASISRARRTLATHPLVELDPPNPELTLMKSGKQGSAMTSLTVVSDEAGGAAAHAGQES